MATTPESFNTFLRKAAPKVVPPTMLVALDPGETTGYAFFDSGKLTAVKQLRTKTIEEGVDELRKIIPHVNQVVLESYRIYSWKSDDHKWAGLHTPQFIGAIKTICHLHKVPYLEQTAQVAKQFVTDDRLKGWGLYNTALRHGNDAIRHGCYYLLFNNKRLPNDLE